jgi:hypothetical protein
MGKSSSEKARSELKGRIDTVEESYEFMLAYAAQGLSGDKTASRSGGEIRNYLQRSDNAMNDLASVYTSLVKHENLRPAERHLSFAKVLEQDAGNAQAAIQLVLAQPSISSQLIDNLNASIHLRALLTDLFLIDEILKLQVGEEKSLTTPTEP